MQVSARPRPDWLRVKLPSGEGYRFVRRVIDENKLHTVCESAHCPNMGECWGAGTATFMILGNICTRSCGFCAVLTGRPTELDWEEPERVAQAVELLQLKHCVITSVNRDELKDGGAEIWARTVRAIKQRMPHTTIEVLLPDFKGNWEALYRVLSERPDVVSHNMETVKRLYRRVRPQAKYERSLEQIRRTKEAGFRTKSGAMLGLGETHKEIIELMQDLRENGCEVLTLGQYLQPTPAHLPVERFVTPEEFALYKEIGLEMGFDYVESGPLVRSSYHSERHVKSIRQS
ncbi:MAG: lipoyl synthase [Bacteroidia bacterium]|nr:lipoyl synthase [Bacteroidia bacterium]MDW8014987.1 lipoyl synthase [Bacteroidia bacterium]